MKGDYNQECNRTACTNNEANYYNESTRKYYCKSCAEEINYWSKRDANITLCSKESKIIKSHNHSHFWIENEDLFESYKTLRGLRYRLVRKAIGFKDCDKCSDETIKKLETSHL